MQKNVRYSRNDENNYIATYGSIFPRFGESSLNVFDQILIEMHKHIQMFVFVSASEIFGNSMEERQLK